MLKRVLLVCALVPLIWAGWALATLPARHGGLAPLAVEAGQLQPPVVRGVYHIHSKASDGTGTVAEIAAAAARAGLAFVVLTDHGDAYRDPAPPRYEGPVLCIDATEISTTDGHYTAIGLGRPPYPLAGEGRDVIEDVRRFGGFGVVAHPDSPRLALRWREWNAASDGIEWLNADSEVRELPAWQWFPTLVQYAVRPAASLAARLHRPETVIADWDRKARVRPLVALAASDAHARFGWRGRGDPYDDRLYLRLPSYQAIFETFALNVELDAPLTGNPAADARAIVDGLRKGDVYTTLDGLAGPATLTFSARSGAVVARQGGTLAMDQAVMLRASANVPAGGELVLYRDGEVVDRVDGQHLRFATNRPGAFRVEARLDKNAASSSVPWILSNHIYVGVPLPPGDGVVPPPLGSGVPLADRVDWFVEADAASTGSERRADVGGGGTVQELTFRLGPAAPSPFVALASRSVDRLRQGGAIGFALSASRPLRVSVQVRLDGGQSNLRLVRSVYADTAPRVVHVSLDDMREAGTGARASMDPARIESLLFVVDTVNARAGDSGVVRIGQVQVEPKAASGPDRQ